MNDTITIVGNIVTEPQQKRTAQGLSITTFRVASGSRRYDRETGSWTDGETSYFRVSVFRRLAEHAFQSLRKGERVVLTGRLRIREWETDTQRGTSAEIEADAIGHDLLFGTTSFHRAVRSGDVPEPPVDEWAVAPTGPSPQVAVATGSEIETPF